MKRIVITGSTRGIGFALAQAFLRRQCAVMLSGRTAESVERAVAQLAQSTPTGQVHGIACDVQEFAQVQALWQAAVERFGGVDIWINNAGLSGKAAPAWQQHPEVARQVVQTNLLGAMHGAIVAAQGMVKQGHGAIYNMEGMGSDGRKHNGLAYYGATKYALHYYTECLAAETRGAPLIVGALRPGMVATEMLSAQYADRPEEWQRAKRVFNLLAEKPEPVAEWLAARILENKRSGVTLKYLTSGRLLLRMLRGLAAKRELFD